MHIYDYSVSSYTVTPSRRNNTMKVTLHDEGDSRYRLSWFSVVVVADDAPHEVDYDNCD